jgi:hypothetical protein
MILRTFAARRSTYYFGARKHHHVTRHGHQQSMDPIKKYARNLDPGIRQCLLTQSAAATPSRILPPHPHVWIRAAQPSGVSRRRHTTQRPGHWCGPSCCSHPPHTSFKRASRRLCQYWPRSDTCIGCLCGPRRILSTTHHRACARVINYWRHSWRRRAHSVPPDHPKRKNEENPSRTARGCHVVPVDIVAKANWPFEKCDKWALNMYEG